MNIYNKLPSDIQRYIKTSLCGLPSDFECIDSNILFSDLFDSIKILKLHRTGKWVRVIDEIEYKIKTSDKCEKLYNCFSIYGSKRVYIEANHTRIDYDEATFKTYIYFKVLEQYERCMLNGDIVESVPTTLQKRDNWDIVVNILNHIRSNIPLRQDSVNPLTYKNTTKPRVYCVFCNIYYKCKHTYKQHLKTTKHRCKQRFYARFPNSVNERLFYIPIQYHIKN